MIWSNPGSDTSAGCSDPRDGHWSERRPLWMDAGLDWRVIAIIFGRVCNCCRDPGFYSIIHLSIFHLINLRLEDYGRVPSPPVQWGCTHEGVAVKAYEQKTGLQVHHSGILLAGKIHSWEHHQMACYLVMMGNLVSWKWNAHTSIVSCMQDNDVHLERVDRRTP